eukprot:364823-Chlamydomonas_euryale.AAC.1
MAPSSRYMSRSLVYPSEGVMLEESATSAKHFVKASQRQPRRATMHFWDCQHMTDFRAPALTTLFSTSAPHEHRFDNTAQHLRKRDITVPYSQTA